MIRNNGLLEAYQNNSAIALCRQLALQSGMSWAGGLATGAGEALSSGRPLAETPGPGRPPVGHLLRALELAAALAQGQPVPGEAADMMAGIPIPGVPVEAWREMFVLTANRHWEEEAA